MVLLWWHLIAAEFLSIVTVSKMIYSEHAPPYTYLRKNMHFSNVSSVVFCSLTQIQLLNFVV